ncbi:MAG: LysR family transcriptional regulator [Lachnospiraceae bacterium]|nr:LysR family transcriptional regulator [Lachnospiraceae bacterium]MBO4461745.1 LysR family transcriptional regulator [Lachnospiraceae bacterium]MBR4795820.1 LysR family transcriptional regulator [Lachnospiraceae bacterium]
MNFTNLNYFLVVAEEMNITRAANRLHISQQALSNHITKLEDEIGTQLFERSPGLSLTYAGARLVETSGQILDIHSQFLNEVKDLSGDIKGELTIGITYTRGQALLPLLLPAFRANHPNVNIRIEEANAVNLEDMLQHGAVDLILGFSPFFSPSAAVTELSTDRIFLAVPVSIMEQLFGDECQRKREEFSEAVDITAFKNQPFILLKKGDRIRTIVDSYFKKHQIVPHVFCESANIQTAFALARKGLGIAVYPEMFLRGETTLSAAMGTDEEMDYYPLGSSATTEHLAIAYNKDRYLPRAAQEFIDLAKNILHNVTGIPKESAGSPEN